MKKYIIMALLPLIFQGDMQCVDYNADLNKAIQQQLISARKAIDNVKLPLELDPILGALVSYARRGDSQSVEAINKMEKIGDALEQYKVDQYTSWTWYFGPTPAIVKDYIQPAIGRVVDNLKSIQTNAMSLGYKIALFVSGAALTALLSGAGLAGWFMFKSKSNNTSPELVSVESVAQKYAETATQQFCYEGSGVTSAQKEAVYGAAYAAALQVTRAAEDIRVYDRNSPESNDILDDQLTRIAEYAAKEECKRLGIRTNWV